MSRPKTLEDAMHRPSRFIAVTIGLAALAACGRATPSTDAGLRRDLDLAKGQGLELVPQGSARSTLSADELSPSGNHARSTAQQASKARTPREAASAPQPQVAERPAPQLHAPAPQQQDSVVATAPVPAATRPSAGAISPPPPGGYKTMGELIRKAPFPINP
jgi:hypothetical protein